MKRREFVNMSLGTLSAAAAGAVLADDPLPKPSEVYELREYTVRVVRQPLLDHYLSQALLPALKRYGNGPTGVLVDATGQDIRRVYVLIVHPSAEQAVTLSARLNVDEVYRKAAAEYLAASPTDPVYTRISSSLMVPIAGLPHLEKPDAQKPRLFKLRIYESHNERAGKKKIEMF